MTNDRPNTNPNRRQYLTTIGGLSVALTAGLAGCMGSTPDDGDSDSDTGDTSGDPSGGDNGTGSTQEQDQDQDQDQEQNTNQNQSGNDTSDSGSKSQPALALLDHDWYEDGQFSAGVKGTAENTTGKAISYAEVSVVFLDSDGVQLESGIDNTTELAGGRKWKFDAMYLGDDPADVADYEISTSTSSY